MYHFKNNEEIRGQTGVGCVAVGVGLQYGGNRLQWRKRQKFLWQRRVWTQCVNASHGQNWVELNVSRTENILGWLHTHTHIGSSRLLQRAEQGFPSKQKCHSWRGSGKFDQVQHDCRGSSSCWDSDTQGDVVFQLILLSFLFNKNQARNRGWNYLAACVCSTGFCLLL